MASRLSIRTPPSAAEPALPPAVRAALRGRVRRALVAAEGRVVDLGGDLCALADYPAEVRDNVSVLAGPIGGLAPGLASAGGCDTVVSMGRLAFVADIDSTIAAVVSALGPEGRLVFLEPDPGPGTILRGTARLWSRAGVAVNGDLTRAMWAEGLSVLRVRRFTIPTLVMPLRHWVWGTARPRRPQGDR